MKIVLMTALGVGGATVLGALIGFLIKKPSARFNDIILSFAAGVMLVAAISGLIIPSLEYGNRYSIVISISGVFAGAACVNVLDRLVPHLHKISGLEGEKQAEVKAQLNKVLLFVIAIAIHNFPEGIAAGVSFGTDNTLEALTVAAGIALQNVPEGMVIIAPMRAVGMNRGRTFVIAMLTGVVEIIGTIVGYFAVSVSNAILPFALAFAGETMLYVISDEMIPETHSHGYERSATYSLLAGCSIMFALDYIL